jgi:phenylacetate-CoA ligase
MPLIRYEVGDYVTLGEPCRCGRTLPVLDRIAGRFRNMLRLPSGDVLWPRYASTIIGKHFPLRQFRMVQTSLEDLVLEVSLDRPLTGDEETRMRSMVLDVVHHPFRLQLRAVESVPRSPSGKFEDFVCILDDEPSSARS